MILPQNVTRESWPLRFFWGLVLSLLLLVPLLPASYSHLDHQLDDGLIYQRYIRNCLQGFGLVYNPGEYVNGLTSPMYGYLLLTVSFLLGDVQLSAVLLSATLSFLTAGMLILLVLAHGKGDRWEHIGAFLAALAQVTVRYSYLTYGMESGLFVFFCGLALWFYLQEHYPTCWWALAGVWLTRPEGIFLIAAIGCDLLRRHRRLPGWRFFAIPGGAYLCQLIFNWFYYGTLLATSAVAKVDQGKSGLWGGASFIKFGLDQVVIVFANHDWGLLFLLALALLGFFSATSSLKVIAAVFLGLDLLFYLVFRIPMHIWYYAPFYLFSWLFLGLGINQLLACFRGRARIMAAGLLIGSSVILFYNLYSYTLLAAGMANRADYREIGLWLKQNTLPSASVAAVEIGTIGWYSERRIVDILGLVSPPNSDFVAGGDFFSWLDHYHPDYILIHDPHWGFENGAESAWRNGEYSNLSDFPFEGFRLLQNAKP